MLHLVETGAAGAVNVAAPPGFCTMAGLLQACADAAGADAAQAAAQLRWVADDTLLALGVKPWVDLPLWLPAQGEHAAFMQVPVGRALALGLSIRPLAQTVADTLAWWRALPPAAQAFTLAGLTAERESALLAALLSPFSAAPMAGQG